MSATITPLTSTAFQAEVLDNPKPVLIDFWAPWCGPCRAMKPVLEQAARLLGDSVEVRTVNVDDEPELAGTFGIRSIPTLVLMHGHTPLDAWQGVLPSDQVAGRVRSHLAALPNQGS